MTVSEAESPVNQEDQDVEELLQHFEICEIVRVYRGAPTAAIERLRAAGSRLVAAGKAEWRSATFLEQLSGSEPYVLWKTGQYTSSRYRKEYPK